VRILEKNHPSSAPESKLQAAPTENPGYAPTTGQSNRHLPSREPPVAAAGSEASAAIPGSGPRYVVRRVEMISAIAQTTLGDWQKWHEIYKLNGQIQPSQPIPAGTVLTMPAEARIPAENKP
jgi:nucleoid-associated protein YgaU